MTSGETISLYDKPSFGTSDFVANGNIGSVPSLSSPSVRCSTRSVRVLRYTRSAGRCSPSGRIQEAARLDGIRSRSSSSSVYAIAGLCAGMGAVVQDGRLAAAAPRSTRRSC